VKDHLPALLHWRGIAALVTHALLYVNSKKNPTKFVTVFFAAEIVDFKSKRIQRIMSRETDGFMSPESEFTPGSLGQIPGPVTWSNFICRSKHPLAAFFHIAFKVRLILVLFQLRFFLSLRNIHS